MKKLSKIVMLVASALVLTVFAGCSNGSSSGSDDDGQKDTILAGKYGVEDVDFNTPVGDISITYKFCDDGKTVIYDYYEGDNKNEYKGTYKILSETEGELTGHPYHSQETVKFTYERTTKGVPTNAIAYLLTGQCFNNEEVTIY